jgi:hypothetical protein
MPRWWVHEGLRCQVAIVPQEMELTDFIVDSGEFRVQLQKVRSATPKSSGKTPKRLSGSIDQRKERLNLIHKFLWVPLDSLV